MNILNFMQRFPDEASCIAYVKEQREQSGVVCKRCGCRERRRDANKLSFGRKHCHGRLPMRSETAMEHGRLPFRYRIAAMSLPAGTKESFPTEELRRRPGHKRCQPVWEVRCKLRDVTGKRDGRYRLRSQVEPGDGFFAIELPLDKRDEPLKRGRGSQKKVNALAMAGSTQSQKNPGKGRPSQTAVHLKMQAMPGLKSETITKIVKEQLEPSVELATGDSTSYVKFDKHVASHEAVTSGKEAVKAFLPWTHIAISNAKRLLLDVHHKIKDRYLQLYLNEFCYKLNRRYFGERLFDRAVLAAVTYTADFKSKTYRRILCG